MNWQSLFLLGLFLTVNSGHALAQTVQLPTFSRFGIGTSVLVPDGGSVVLGGVRRSRMGSVSRGLPGGRLGSNRAIGRDDMAAGVSVHATIIDLRELDEAVLAEAAKRRTAPLGDDVQAAARAEHLIRHMGRKRH